MIDNALYMMNQQENKEQIVLPILTLKSGNVRFKDGSKSPRGSNESSPEKTSSSDSLRSSPLKNVGPLSCSIVYETGACDVFFKIPDQKFYHKTGEVRHTMLECSDITAADLKVTTKFGSWNSMTCRLLVECRQPLNAWSTIKPGDIAATLDSGVFGEPLTPEQIASLSPNQVTYVRRPQESCMVKATFDVFHVSQLRDLLHVLKLEKLKERKSLQEKHRQGVDRHVPIPSKIKEGLPEWVNYIPAKWYSSTIRQVIEYLLVLYTILTLTWAVWQLYKNVGVIRAYLRPFVEFVEYLLSFMKAWFRWLDAFAEMLSTYWWSYMKPMFLIITPLYTSLAHLFKPLRNIAGLVGAVAEPIVRVTRPLLRSASTIFNVFFDVSRRCSQTLMAIWNMTMNSALMRLAFHRCEQLGVTNLIHRFSLVNLDPLKAQVLLMQHLLLRSFKQVFYGFRFLVSKIYFMYLFLIRERAYVSEGQAGTASNTDASANDAAVTALSNIDTSTKEKEE